MTVPPLASAGTIESLNHAFAFSICSAVLVDSSDSKSSRINKSGRVDPCRSPLVCVPSPFASTLILLDVINSYLLSRSEEHTSELQSRGHLVCRLLLEKK